MSSIKKKLTSKEAKISILIVLFAVIIYIKTGTESAIDNNKIHRNSYGEMRKAVTIEATIDGENSYEMELEVQSVRYSDEVLEEMYESARTLLEESILECEENFTGKFVFTESLSDYPFSFKWRVKDREAVTDDGKIIAHEDGSTIVFLSATYDDWVKEDSFVINYKAADRDDFQILKEDLIKEVNLSEEKSRTDEYISLPQSINGKAITYRDPQAKREPLVFLLALAAIIAVFYGAKKDNQKKEMERKEKILEEYSTVIQKMVMYLSAGMSLRNVWIRIYEDSRESGRNNPIYDEMAITVNELKNGVSESKAYLSFSKRIGIPVITRFTTLITQNLKKGSTNLSELLYEEAEMTFEGRKKRALVKGEEAGTLLLIPMILLLVVVMVIIMVPALWSM